MVQTSMQFTPVQVLQAARRAEAGLPWMGIPHSTS